MPTRPWLRRISIAGLVGRERSRVTLSTGLTLPVALAGALAVPGCRTDATSARLSPLNPTQWLQHRDRADAVDLQPVPAEPVTAPLPTSTVGADPFTPRPEPEPPLAPPAPAPEPDDGTDAFYGVRPTSGELAPPREPSWTNRFRSLLRRDTPSEPTAGPIRSASAARSGEESPPRPSMRRITRRSTVSLGVPEFEAAAENVAASDAESPAVRTVAQTEPVRPPRARRPEPLPLIVPARPAVRMGDQDAPQAWPYAVPEQPEFTPAPAPMLLEPEPSPPALLREIEEFSGPALLR